MKRIIVTGAAGYVGRHLVTGLLGAGCNVAGVGRSQEKPPPENYRHHVLEIGPKTDWTNILRGVDAVVHLADGLNRFEGRQSIANSAAATSLIEGSLRLAVAAIEAGVGTFIYVSSIKAMCGEYFNGILTEKSRVQPTRPYGRLKRELEVNLEKLVDPTAMRRVTLRIPIVHGPKCRSNIARVVKLCDTPLPLPVGGLRNARSLISVDNLCSAIATIIDNEAGPQGTWLVDDGRPVSTEKLFGTLRDGLARPRRLFPVPMPVWRMLEKLPKFGPVTLRLTRSLEISSARFQSDYAWQPAETTVEALTASAQSFRQS